MMLRTCLINGLKISLLERRAGRTAVLLIHGNSSCKEVFAKQFHTLARTDLSVVIPDLPGHGGSDDARTPSATYSFPGYAKVLGALMHALNYRRYHVIGWSLGGHIGLEMWARDSSVKSLLVSGTPPIVLNGPGVQAGFRWNAATSLAGKAQFGADDVRRYVRAMMGRPLAPDHHLSRAAGRTDGRARRWMVKNGMAGCGTDEVCAVSETSRPLAVVQGVKDVFVRIGYLNSLNYKNIWTGSPVLIDAGHAAHWETPAIFNGKMRAFLEYAN